MVPHFPYIWTSVLATVTDEEWYPSLMTEACSCFPQCKSWRDEADLRTAGKAKLSGGVPEMVMSMYTEMASWKWLERVWERRVSTH